MKLFGTSGIRGIANKELNPEFLIDIGSAVGSIYKKIILGYDVRTSSVMFANALISGALSTGGEVFNASLVTTPTLSVNTEKFDCGIMVTASHNPPEYNGIKFWTPNRGMAFDTKKMYELETVYEEKKYSYRKWHEIGNVQNYPFAIEFHKEKILKIIPSVEKKVVIDCGTGSAGTIAPYLFKELGCNVITLNASFDGYFSARAPEPSEEELYLLKKTVLNTNADLGIAYDGDGDRMVAVDEKGNFVPGDKLLAVFCTSKDIKKIIVSMDTSMAVDKYLEGKEIIRTRVGDVYIAEKLSTTGDFGGEPSGTWIFKEYSLCPDGIYASVKLAQLLEDRKLSELTEKIPQYYTLRCSIKCDKNLKHHFLRLLDMEIRRVNSGMENAKIDTTDGYWVSLQNGWFLIRPSGTEDKIRLTVEGYTKEDAKKIYEFAKNIVKECVKHAKKHAK